MTRLLSGRVQVCTLFLVWLLFPVSAFAQQNVFNVPNSEVTEKGKFWTQVQGNVRPWRPHRMLDMGVEGAYGIGHNTELNLSLFNVNTPNPDNMSLAPGFKTALPLMKKRFPERDFKLTVGDLVPVSLQGEGVGNWGYSHVSGKVPKLKTRLTAGVSAGTSQIFGRNTAHFIGAIEQPLTKNEKLKFIADWLSGSHDYGFFTPGVEYEFNDHIKLEVGYQIPNTVVCGHQAITVQVETKF